MRPYPLDDAQITTITARGDQGVGIRLFVMGEQGMALRVGMKSFHKSGQALRCTRHIYIEGYDRRIVRNLLI